jgi:hypothetical protein
LGSVGIASEGSTLRTISQGNFADRDSAIVAKSRPQAGRLTGGGLQRKNRAFRPARAKLRGKFALCGPYVDDEASLGEPAVNGIEVVKRLYVDHVPVGPLQFQIHFE